MQLLFACGFTAWARSWCSVLCSTVGSFSGYWIKGLDVDKVDLRPDGEISLSLKMILARGSLWIFLWIWCLWTPHELAFMMVRCSPSPGCKICKSRHDVCLLFVSAGPERGLAHNRHPPTEYLLKSPCFVCSFETTLTSETPANETTVILVKIVL